MAQGIIGNPPIGGGKRLLWHGPGSRATFAGRILPGMFYAAEGTGIPCVLDSRLPTLNRPPIPREIARNPSYATLSPEHRNMLLNWYEGGRITADVPTGIALLHLFSLERRLLVGNPASEEAALLRREVRRLLRLLGEDGVFKKTASLLLEEADRRAVMTGEEPILLLTTIRHSMTAGLRLHIARLSTSHTPLGFEEAMAGWLGLGEPDEGRENQPLRPRLSNPDVPALVAACANFWTGSFPRGMILDSSGVPRLPQHDYIPAMWGLRPLSLLHDAGLPDPQAADWRRMNTFVSSVWSTMSQKQRDEKKAAVKPPRAVSKATSQMAAGAAVWLSTLNEHAVIPCNELTTRMIGGGQPPTRRVLSQVAALLGTKGWGMEPDPLWSDALAPKDGPAFIFRLDSSEARSEEIRPEWPLAVLFWAAADEEPARLRDACTAAASTLDQRRRLRLCGGWWESSPKARRVRLKWASRTLAGMGRAEECLDALTAFLRGSNALPSNTGMTILEDVSKAMGLGSPWSRVMGLEKPRATGKGRKPPPDVVMIGAGDIIPEGRSIPAPPENGVSSGGVYLPPPTQKQTPAILVLDPAILERVERETREAAGILAAIWEDEIPEAIAQQPCPPGGYDGLLPSAARLLGILISRNAWDAQSLAEAAAAEGLKSGGAIEAINEWSWNRVDAPVFEEDGQGGIIVDDEIAASLTTR